MAVNALGLPLLLQASSTQLQDLPGGLKAGDTMTGRLVELLPQGKAVVNLAGQNVVAQLPAGRNFQRGDQLALQVSQASAAEAGKPASLQLRLLPPAPQAPSALPPSAAAPQPVIQLEQALSAAKLPINNVTMAVAQTLARLGAPLSAAALTAAVVATEALLANEAPPAPQGSATPLQDPALQQTLREVLGQLKVAAQLSPSSQNTVLLQQAARELGQAIANAPAPALPLPKTAQGVAPPPPQTEPAPASAAVPQASSLISPLPALSPLAQRIQTAVAGLVAAPSTAGLQALADLLNEAQAPIQTPPAAPAQVQIPSPAPAGNNPAASVSAQAPVATLTAVLQAPPSAAASPALPAKREALAQWLGQLRQEPGPQTASSLAQSAQALADALLDAGQPASQRLLQAVQAQAPQAEPQATLQSARQALLDVAGHFEALANSQPGRSLPSLSAVQAELDSLSLPTPRLALNSLPPETVAEAVAWLQARDLPPQRPLVETVATWMEQGRSVMPTAEKAVQSVESLPPQLLQEQPALRSALSDARLAFENAAFKPEADGLASRLQQWAKDQGLSLENSLAKNLLSDLGGGAGPAKAALGAATAEGQGLRPALMKLEHELQQVLRSTEASSPAVAKQLDEAVQNVQTAVRSMNALPLQAQAAPAFDTVHLPLPVWMNGQIGAGNLSVSWRNGRERGLDDKEPVNVAVALKTESLGEVKVLLQVWKNAASARVVGETPEATAFLKSGAAELREGFGRTPFALQSLDFASAEADTPSADDAPEAPRGGLSLSA